MSAYEPSGSSSYSTTAWNLVIHRQFYHVEHKAYGLLQPKTGRIGRLSFKNYCPVPLSAGGGGLKHEMAKWRDIPTGSLISKSAAVGENSAQVNLLK